MLGKLLGESANISQFQQDYEILFIDEDSRQFEERVFGQLKAHARDYPENTSLQQAGKTYLIKGGKIGKATGAF